METQNCRACKRDKALSEFWLRDKVSGRRHAQCVTCMTSKRSTPEALAQQRISERARYQRNPQKVLDKNRGWIQRNLDKHQVRTKRWRLAHPEKHKESVKKWTAANIERAREYRARYYAENREKYRALIKAWAKENADRLRALGARHGAERRAKEMKATPSWADQDAIFAVYVEARLISLETGVKHHVDHMVPLRSKLVCGLHVENNLQVIPSVDNMRKGNRHWPDML